MDYFAVSYELFDPAYGHPTQNQPTVKLLNQVDYYSHASLGISKFLMVANQMLLVPRILLHGLVVL